MNLLEVAIELTSISFLRIEESFSYLQRERERERTIVFQKITKLRIFEAPKKIYRVNF